LVADFRHRLPVKHFAEHLAIVLSLFNSPWGDLEGPLLGAVLKNSLSISHDQNPGPRPGPGRRRTRALDEWLPEVPAPPSAVSGSSDPDPPTAP
jgi:hypothetical protein